MSFALCLRAKAEGGSLRTIGETLVVENVNAVTFVLSAASSFRELTVINLTQVSQESQKNSANLAISRLDVF